MPDVEARRRAAEQVRELYRSHASSVRRWIRRLRYVDADEVDDLVQEIFLTALRQLPTFRGDAQITTWLYAITLRTALRFRRRSTVAERKGADDSGDGRGGDDVAELARTPAEDAETQATVRDVLRALPPQTTTLLVLADVAGFSGEEIAEMNGGTPNSVWVALHRARRKFRDRFDP